jgi:hypothetical protein
MSACGDLKKDLVRAAWIDICGKSQMMLHGFLVVAAEAYLCVRGGVDAHPSHSRLRHTLYGITIREVNKEIASLDDHKKPSDEVLACIKLLASWTNGSRRPSYVNTTSFLSLGQALYQKSLEGSVKVHRDAIYYLVKRKGGLDKISMYGLDRLIQWCVHLPYFLALLQTDIEQHRYFMVHTRAATPRLPLEH